MEEIKLNEDCGNQPNKSNKKGIWIGVLGVFILLTIVTIIIVSVAKSENSDYLTYSKYTQIQNGMSYSQVTEILDGHQGVLDTSSGFGGYTLCYYTWSNNSGTKCIVIGFENDKVCAKSQFGLG